MKLYELPGRPDKPIKIYGVHDGDEPVVVLYHHIDGMYSFCTIDTDDGPVVHLKASLEIEPHRDGYKIKDVTDGTDTENNGDTAI